MGLELKLCIAVVLQGFCLHDPASARQALKFQGRVGNGETNANEDETLDYLKVRS